MALLEPREVRLSGGVRVLVRGATELDAPGVLEFLREVMGDSPHLLTQPFELPDEAGERQWIAKHTGCPGSLAMLAEVEGVVVGLLSFSPGARARTAHHGTLGITVRSAWRGRGLGRQMMLGLLEWARAHPTLEKVCLGVFATNTRAIALYESLGFREEARRRGEIKLGPGRYVDEVQMSLWVKAGPEGVPVHRPGEPR
ncbi:MAG TPA: GNAT family protein [Phycisphaerales bacterium]|nr:GNAT family protein [Phycisphaerales bacterium]